MEFLLSRKRFSDDEDLDFAFGKLFMKKYTCKLFNNLKFDLRLINSDGILYDDYDCHNLTI